MEQANDLDRFLNTFRGYVKADRRCVGLEVATVHGLLRQLYDQWAKSGTCSFPRPETVRADFFALAGRERVDAGAGLAGRIIEELRLPAEGSPRLAAVLRTLEPRVLELTPFARLVAGLHLILGRNPNNGIIRIIKPAALAVPNALLEERVSLGQAEQAAAAFWAAIQATSLSPTEWTSGLAGTAAGTWLDWMIAVLPPRQPAFADDQYDTWKKVGEFRRRLYVGPDRCRDQLRDLWKTCAGHLTPRQ